MTHSSVQIQIAPEVAPTTPCWFAEVAIVAQILKTYGLVNLIETKVQFARARFDQYDLIDFVAVLSAVNPPCKLFIPVWLRFPRCSWRSSIGAVCPIAAP